MSPILRKLEKTFSSRCAAPSMPVSLWHQVCGTYPPHLDTELHSVPSMDIAMNSGDLGLSLLWIVQASLVRGLIGDITAGQADNKNLFSEIGPATIGALAHNDDRERPVIISPGRILNGTKRYITGGTSSDFIFVTSREKADDKISHLVMVRTRDIPPGSLIDLDLDSLKTVGHGRLMLSDFTVPDGCIIPCEGKPLRRSIKRWSIIERSLIMQSFMGLMHYINRAIIRETSTIIIEENELDSAIKTQNETVREQIASAVAGDLIDEKHPVFQQSVIFLKNLGRFLTDHRDILPEQLLLRFDDLNFMLKISR